MVGAQTSENYIACNLISNRRAEHTNTLDAFDFTRLLSIFDEKNSNNLISMWKCEQRETKRISLNASPLSNIFNHFKATFSWVNMPLNMLGNELTKSLLQFDFILSSRVSRAIPFSAVLLCSIKIDRLMHSLRDSQSSIGFERNMFLH